MSNMLDLDSYSTKQSNYFLYEDSPSNITLFSSHLKSKPPFDSGLLHQRKKSFKDDMKVEFLQQKCNLGDTNQIDPITLRPGKNNLAIERSQNTLQFEFNSIDFSKPFPLTGNNLETLTRELGKELDLGGGNKQTEALEYTSSKDVVSFSVSPLTTNISDRRAKLTTIEGGDFQTINTLEEEEEEETSPEFNCKGDNKNVSTDEKKSSDKKKSWFCKNNSKKDSNINSSDWKKKEYCFSSNGKNSQKNSELKSEEVYIEETKEDEENVYGKTSNFNNDEENIHNRGTSIFDNKVNTFDFNYDQIRKTSDFSGNISNFKSNNNSNIYSNNNNHNNINNASKLFDDNNNQKNKTYNPVHAYINNSSNGSKEGYYYNNNNHKSCFNYSNKADNFEKFSSYKKNDTFEEKYQEIESFIDTSSCKKGKLSRTENEIRNINKKLSFEEDEILDSKQLNSMKKNRKREKQFSFAEIPIPNEEVSEQNKQNTNWKEERENSFHHVYETILHKLFNEKNVKKTTNYPIFSEKPLNSKKASKINSGTRGKTEKKLNKREMTSYIEKIMTEAHKYKENKENSINTAIFNFNTQNSNCNNNSNCNKSDFKKKKGDSKTNASNQPQNTIIITNNRGVSPRDVQKDSKNSKRTSNFFHLDLSDVPVLIPLKTSNTSDKKSRRFSTFLY